MVLISHLIFFQFIILIYFAKLPYSCIMASPSGQHSSTKYVMNYQPNWEGLRELEPPKAQRKLRRMAREVARFGNELSIEFRKGAYSAFYQNATYSVRKLQGCMEYNLMKPCDKKRCPRMHMCAICMYACMRSKLRFPRALDSFGTMLKAAAATTVGTAALSTLVASSATNRAPYHS